MVIGKIGVLLSVLTVVVCVVAAGEDIFDEQDNAILEAFSAYHLEIQYEAIRGCKETYGYSDDGFSEKLVALAEKTKIGERRDLHSCVVSYLKDYGTSNALDYVLNEARNGPDSNGGFEAFALISAFNDTSFALASELFYAETTTGVQKDDFYRFINAVLYSGDEFCGRMITREQRKRILSYLHVKAAEERLSPRYLDQILLTYSPEYGKSDERKRIIASLIESVPTNLPTYAYFQDEYAKHLKDGKEQKEGISPKNESLGNEATQPDEGFWKESKSMPLLVLASLVAAAAVVGYSLKRKGR